MHVYQMRSSNQSIVSATQQRLTTCMNALKDVSRVWLVAKMVHTLFESILGNKVLEERLQKAAGKRHVKTKQNGNSAGNKHKSSTPMEPTEAQKRKFDDMEMGYTNGPPAPQMSYERSRPQSPAINEHAAQQQQQHQQQQLPTHISTSSPPMRQSTDAFMGVSRSNTRPTTPFNNFSYPGTPPDLFLHTRNSPNISQDLWQNYAPDQLFPPEANTLFPLQSPNSQMVDPALRNSGPTMQQPSQPQPQQQQQQQPIFNMSQQHMAMPNEPSQPQMNYQQDPQAWAQMQAMQQQAQQQHQQGGQRPDDAWSNHSGSTGGPIVPTTLNVGDWFEVSFFLRLNELCFRGMWVANIFLMIVLRYPEWRYEWAEWRVWLKIHGRLNTARRLRFDSGYATRQEGERRCLMSDGNRSRGSRRSAIWMWLVSETK